VTTIRLYVVDTSYFLELYRVDGCWEKEAFTAIQHKFSEAIRVVPDVKFMNLGYF